MRGRKEKLKQHKDHRTQ